jgi:hypothetical protein
MGRKKKSAASDLLEYAFPAPEDDDVQDIDINRYDDEKTDDSQDALPSEEFIDDFDLALDDKI